MQSQQTTTKKQKKSSKNNLTSGKNAKIKKIKNQSPIVKTQSTEDTLGLFHEQKSGSSQFDEQVTPSRKEKKNSKKDLAQKKHVRDQLNFEEHKSAQINLLGKRFKIEDEMLGLGTFGRAYVGKDFKKNKQVAIKIMLNKRSMDSFLREATALRSLNYIKANGFPQMLMSAYNDDICVIVSEILGQNLETLRKKFGKLSIATACSVGIQMINRLEVLHSCGFIHRDIKPQNVLLGYEEGDKKNKIYLIDFGLSVQYLDENGNHVQQLKSYGSVVGTALFASINAHRGNELSRRDDIESFVYTIIYLITGALPWKNINIKKKKERHQVIMYMKEEISFNTNFQEQMDLPQEFFEMLRYSQSLNFEEEPNYKYLKSLLQRAIKKLYDIKKITDIDILNNNNEEIKNVDESQKPQIVDNQIDVNGIACQIGIDLEGCEKGNASELNLNSDGTLNDHLVLRSQVDGGTHQMNTNEIKEEMTKQLSIFKQICNNQISHDEFNQQYGNFDRIIEEECESESYGDEDEEDSDDDQDSKGDQEESKQQEEEEEVQEDEDEEDCCDIDDENDEGVGYHPMDKYNLETNGNNLKQISALN